jgi:predicted GNAT family acetyltransferase
MVDTAEVEDVPQRSRYEISIGARRVGRLDYDLDGATMTLPHTEIDPAYGGRGLGGVLVRRALDDMRARDLRIRPRCSFVGHFIEQHPEYADLVQEP